MANSTFTGVDNASIELEGGKFRDDTLLFTAIDTLVQGTILARKLVSDTIGVAYTRAGTSTYTVAAATDALATPELGAHVVTAGTLSSGVGEWTAVAPSGKTETFTSTADTDNLAFPHLGLTLTTTAGGGTTWDDADVITVTPAVQTGLPLIPFAIAGDSG